MRVQAGGPTLPWDELRAYQRNTLKARKHADLDKLCASIMARGFAFPIFVWAGHDYVIDGSGRLPALERLEELGHVLPEAIPVAMISAATEAEAAELVLLASSSHGEVTEASLLGFAQLHQVQLAQVAAMVEIQGLSIEDMARRQAGLVDGQEQENPYTDKVQVPIYEPHGECPALADLCDRTKVTQLLRDIGASTLPEDIRAFLRFAAERHTRFRYDRIANYYAHADAATQALMEASALVVIDFERAIELGFVHLRQDIDEAFHQDYPDA